MARRTNSKLDIAQTLRAAALRHPETSEGIACEGTSAEKRTIQARGKSFLFVRTSDAMFKLGESLPEAVALAKRDPTRFKVGAHGWVTVTFGDASTLPIEQIERWIGESCRSIAPKQVVATLPKAGPASGRARRTAKAKTLKRRQR